MTITKAEIKTICELVRQYCKGQISRDEYWRLRDEMFPERNLFCEIEKDMVRP